VRPSNSNSISSNIEQVLVELLGLTNYVRYIDIELMLFELLDLTNYVRYLDIEQVLVELLGLTNYVVVRPAPALFLGSAHSL
jgi:hypothetical protein